MLTCGMMKPAVEANSLFWGQIVRQLLGAHTGGNQGEGAPHQMEGGILDCSLQDYRLLSQGDSRKQYLMFT